MDFFSESNEDVKIANQKWEKYYRKSELEKDSTQVSFNDEVITYFLPENHKKNNISNWEIYGRDRMRFQRRIKAMENPLTKVLEYSHRIKIYKKLYE